MLRKAVSDDDGGIRVGILSLHLVSQFLSVCLHLLFLPFSSSVSVTVSLSRSEGTQSVEPVCQISHHALEWCVVWAPIPSIPNLCFWKCDWLMSVFWHIFQMSPRRAEAVECTGSVLLISMYIPGWFFKAGSSCTPWLGASNILWKVVWCWHSPPCSLLALGSCAALPLCPLSNTRPLPHGCATTGLVSL